MSIIHYVHVWSIDGFDTQTKFTTQDGTVYINNIGLQIDAWPSDDLFCIAACYFVSERLRSILQYHQFEHLTFEKIDRISKGGNFQANFPTAKLPSHYWKLNCSGTVGTDDFGIWDRKFLIVSDKGLSILRDNHVTHAESDLIGTSLEDYFGSDRHHFWMSPAMRKYFEKHV